MEDTAINMQGRGTVHLCRIELISLDLGDNKRHNDDVKPSALKGIYYQSRRVRR